MMLHVPKVLSAEEVASFRERLATAAWTDGRITAGHQSAQVKHNLQLQEADPMARELAGTVLAALQKSQMFFAAALPRQIFPPYFNCYRPGHDFGNHVDNAIRYDRSGVAAGQPARAVRTDVSVTLFLSEPTDYDGGELCIESASGTHQVKLPAGDLVLYPSTSVHRVLPVTRGERLASFFWLQSLVRDAGQRQLLFDLDMAIQRLTTEVPSSPALVELVGVYHNLLRRWADV